MWWDEHIATEALRPKPTTSHHFPAPGLVPNSCFYPSLLLITCTHMT